jgi:hypothetical protein
LNAAGMIKPQLTMREVIKWIRRFNLIKQGQVSAASKSLWVTAGWSLLAPRVEETRRAELGDILCGAFTVDQKLHVNVGTPIVLTHNEVQFRLGDAALTFPVGSGPGEVDLSQSPLFDVDTTMGKLRAGPPASFQRTLVQVVFATRACEPVLLVGPSCYKSLVVDTWCRIFGVHKSLLRVHLTPETDSPDLIGQMHPYSLRGALTEIVDVGHRLLSRVAAVQRTARSVALRSHMAAESKLRKALGLATMAVKDGLGAVDGSAAVPSVSSATAEEAVVDFSDEAHILAHEAELAAIEAASDGVDYGASLYNAPDVVDDYGDQPINGRFGQAGGSWMFGGTGAGFGLPAADGHCTFGGFGGGFRDVPGMEAGNPIGGAVGDFGATAAFGGSFDDGGFEGAGSSSMAFDPYSGTIASAYNPYSTGADLYNGHFGTASSFSPEDSLRTEAGNDGAFGAPFSGFGSGVSAGYGADIDQFSASHAPGAYSGVETSQAAAIQSASPVPPPVPVEPTTHAGSVRALSCSSAAAAAPAAAPAPAAAAAAAAAASSPLPAAASPALASVGAAASATPVCRSYVYGGADTFQSAAVNSAPPIPVPPPLFPVEPSTHGCVRKLSSAAAPASLLPAAARSARGTPGAAATAAANAALAPLGATAEVQAGKISDQPAKAVRVFSNLLQGIKDVMSGFARKSLFSSGASVPMVPPPVPVEPTTHAGSVRALSFTSVAAAAAATPSPLPSAAPPAIASVGAAANAALAPLGAAAEEQVGSLSGLPAKVVRAFEGLLQGAKDVVSGLPESCRDGTLDQMLGHMVRAWRVANGDGVLVPRTMSLFRDGPLTTAAMLACPVLLEDLDQPNQAVTERANCMLEPNPSFSLAEDVSLEGNTAVPLLAGFQVFATVHRAVGSQQIGLSSATRSRFTEINVAPYSGDELQAVLLFELRRAFVALGFDPLCSEVKVYERRLLAGASIVAPPLNLAPDLAPDVVQQLNAQLQPWLVQLQALKAAVNTHSDLTMLKEAVWCSWQQLNPQVLVAALGIPDELQATSGHQLGPEAALLQRKIVVVNSMCGSSVKCGIEGAESSALLRQAVKVGLHDRAWESAVVDCIRIAAGVDTGYVVNFGNPAHLLCVNPCMQYVPHMHSMQQCLVFRASQRLI